MIIFLAEMQDCSNIYVCGPTVYSDIHIGHMRVYIMADLLKRINPECKLFVNITDIDDKILELKADTKYYTEQFMNLCSHSNIHFDEVIKVSESLPLIREFVDKMILHANTDDQGIKLIISNELHDDYNIFNHPSAEPDKGFYIWKTDDVNTEYSQLGRPGWHTECAAFIDKLNNHNSLLYHVGGIDLQFTHHTNENIQYLIVNGKPISKNWIHVGHVLTNGVKMSKSLGNVINASDIDPNILRLLYLSVNYSDNIDVTMKLLTNYTKIWNNILKRIFSGVKIPLRFPKFHIIDNMNPLMCKQMEFMNTVNDLSSSEQLINYLESLGFSIPKLSRTELMLIQSRSLIREIAKTQVTNQDERNLLFDLTDYIRDELLNHHEWLED